MTTAATIAAFLRRAAVRPAFSRPASSKGPWPSSQGRGNDADFAAAGVDGGGGGCG